MSRAVSITPWWASEASKERVSFAQRGFAQRNGNGNESKLSPELPGWTPSSPASTLHQFPPLAVS